MFSHQPFGHLSPFFVPPPLLQGAYPPPPPPQSYPRAWHCGWTHLAEDLHTGALTWSTGALIPATCGNETGHCEQTCDFIPFSSALVCLMWFAKTGRLPENQACARTLNNPPNRQGPLILNGSSLVAYTGLMPACLHQCSMTNTQMHTIYSSRYTYSHGLGDT